MSRPLRSLLLGLHLMASCGPVPEPAPSPPRTPPTGLSGTNAFNEALGLIDIYPRHAGSPGAELSARYLADRLSTHGVPNEILSFENKTPQGRQSFHNVIGRLPGTELQIVILGSHFDTKVGMPEGFEGANDSGSSSGLLLELARVLSTAPSLPFAVWFAFFDGEECLIRYGPGDGLHGSRHLADRLATANLIHKVRAMILLDMVGDPDLTITIPRNSAPELVQRVFAAAHTEGFRHHFRLLPMEILDDHVPFLRAGIPAINLIDFEFGSAPGRNDYWHTEHDHRGHLSPDSLEKVGLVVLRLLTDLATE